MIATAGGMATNLVSRIGYGDFPSNSSGWTLFVRLRIPSTPGATNYLAAVLLSAGVADFTHPYLILRSTNNTSDLFARAYNGSSTQSTSAQAISNTTQAWAAVTYSGTTLTLIVNGSTIGTATIAMSTVTFD